MQPIDNAHTDTANMNTDAKLIAYTILEQLGGNQFIVMTGAKNFVYGGACSLQFCLPGRGVKNKANKVTITLVGDEHYELTFYKIRSANIKQISQHTPIPENIREIFTHETGLYCTLGMMGKK
jgi:hypothetical protein